MTTPMSRTSWVEGAAGSGFDVDHLPYGVFARSGETPRVGGADRRPGARPERRRGRRHGRHARSCSTSPPSTRSWPPGRRCGSPPGRGSTGLLTDQTERDLVEPAPRAGRLGDDAAAVRGRRLRRLLRLRAPRLQRRPDVPARLRAAAAQLEEPPGRLPRPLRHGRRLAAPTSSARAGSARRRRTTLPTYGPSQRLDIEAELGFVVGVPSRDGRAGGHRRLRAAHLRRRGPQRLVGARHPGLGVRPARPLPRQVVRDLDQRVGHPAGGARRRLDRPARPGRPAGARLPPRRRARRPRHRGGGGARRRGRRPSALPRPCTGRRPRCWPTPPSTAPACAPATCGRRARSPAPSRTSAARCSS